MDCPPHPRTNSNSPSPHELKLPIPARTQTPHPRARTQTPTLTLTLYPSLRPKARGFIKPLVLTSHTTLGTRFEQKKFIQKQLNYKTNSQSFKQTHKTSFTNSQN
jgi:hypothetical protein